MHTSEEESLQKDLEQARKDLADTKLSQQKLREKMDGMFDTNQREREDLEARIQKLEAEAQDLESRLKILQGVLDEKGAEIEGLKREIESLKQQDGDNKDQIGKLEQQLANNQAERNNLQTQLTEVNAQKDAAETGLNQAQARVGEIENGLLQQQEANKALQEANDRLQNKLIELQAQLQTALRANAVLQNGKRNVDEQLRAAQTQINELREQLASQSGLSGSPVQSIRTALEAEEAKVATLTQEKAELEQRLREAALREQDLQAQVDNLTKQLKKLNRTNANLSIKIHRVGKDRDKVQRELVDARQRIQELTNLQRTTKKELDEALQNVANANERLLELNQKATVDQNTIAKLKEEREQHQERAGQLDAENQVLQTKLKQANQERDDLQVQVNYLTRQLEELGNENSDLHRQLPRGGLVVKEGIDRFTDNRFIANLETKLENYIHGLNTRAIRVVWEENENVDQLAGVAEDRLEELAHHFGWDKDGGEDLRNFLDRRDVDLGGAQPYAQKIEFCQAAIDYLVLRDDWARDQQIAVWFANRMVELTQAQLRFAGGALNSEARKLTDEKLKEYQAQVSQLGQERFEYGHPVPELSGQVMLAVEGRMQAYVKVKIDELEKLGAGDKSAAHRQKLDGYRNVQNRIATHIEDLKKAVEDRQFGVCALPDAQPAAFRQRLRDFSRKGLEYDFALADVYRDKQWNEKLHGQEYHFRAYAVFADEVQEAGEGGVDFANLKAGVVIAANELSIQIRNVLAEFHIDPLTDADSYSHIVATIERMATALNGLGADVVDANVQGQLVALYETLIEFEAKHILANELDSTKYLLPDGVNLDVLKANFEQHKKDFNQALSRQVKFGIAVYDGGSAGFLRQQQELLDAFDAFRIGDQEYPELELWDVAHNENLSLEARLKAISHYLNLLDADLEIVNLGGNAQLGNAGNTDGKVIVHIDDNNGTLGDLERRDLAKKEAEAYRKELKDKLNKLRGTPAQVIDLTPTVKFADDALKSKQAEQEKVAGSGLPLKSVIDLQEKGFNPYSWEEYQAVLAQMLKLGARNELGAFEPVITKVYTNDFDLIDPTDKRVLKEKLKQEGSKRPILYRMAFVENVGDARNPKYVVRDVVVPQEMVESSLKAWNAGVSTTYEAAKPKLAQLAAKIETTRRLVGDVIPDGYQNLNLYLGEYEKLVVRLTNEAGGIRKRAMQLLQDLFNAAHQLDANGNIVDNNAQLLAPDSWGAIDRAPYVADLERLHQNLVDQGVKPADALQRLKALPAFAANRDLYITAQEGEGYEKLVKKLTSQTRGDRTLAMQLLQDLFNAADRLGENGDIVDDQDQQLGNPQSWIDANIYSTDYVAELQRLHQGLVAQGLDPDDALKKLKNSLAVFVANDSWKNSNVIAGCGASIEMFAAAKHSEKPITKVTFASIAGAPASKYATQYLDLTSGGKPIQSQLYVYKLETTIADKDRWEDGIFYKAGDPLVRIVRMLIKGQYQGKVLPVTDYRGNLLDGVHLGSSPLAYNTIFHQLRNVDTVVEVEAHSFDENQNLQENKKKVTFAGLGKVKGNLPELKGSDKARVLYSQNWDPSRVIKDLRAGIAKDAVGYSENILPSFRFNNFGTGVDAENVITISGISSDADAAQVFKDLIADLQSPDPRKSKALTIFGKNFKDAASRKPLRIVFHGNCQMTNLDQLEELKVAGFEVSIVDCQNCTNLRDVNGLVAHKDSLKRVRISNSKNADLRPIAKLRDQNSPKELGELFVTLDQDKLKQVESYASRHSSDPLHVSSKIKFGESAFPKVWTSLEPKSFEAIMQQVRQEDNVVVLTHLSNEEVIKVRQEALKHGHQVNFSHAKDADKSRWYNHNVRPSDSVLRMVLDLDVENWRYFLNEGTGIGNRRVNTCKLYKAIDAEFEQRKKDAVDNIKALIEPLKTGLRDAANDEARKLLIIDFQQKVAYQFGLDLEHNVVLKPQLYGADVDEATKAAKAALDLTKELLNKTPENLKRFNQAGLKQTLLGGVKEEGGRQRTDLNGVMANDNQRFNQNDPFPVTDIHAALKTNRSIVCAYYLRQQLAGFEQQVVANPALDTKVVLDLSEFSHIRTLGFYVGRNQPDNYPNLANKITGLNFTNCQDLDRTLVRDLKCLTNLKYIDFTGSNITDEQIQDFHRELKPRNVQIIGQDGKEVEKSPQPSPRSPKGLGLDGVQAGAGVGAVVF